MEICKAPTLRLKALNKHSITHIVYNTKLELVLLDVNDKHSWTVLLPLTHIHE